MRNSYKKLIKNSDDDSITTLLSMMNAKKTSSIGSLITKGNITLDEYGQVFVKIDPNKNVAMRRLSIGPCRGRFIVNKYWHLKSSLSRSTLSEPLLSMYNCHSSDDDEDNQDDQDDYEETLIGCTKDLVCHSRDCGAAGNYVLYIHIYILDLHNNKIELYQFSEENQKEIINEILSRDILDRVFYDFKIQNRYYNEITKILHIEVKVLKTSDCYDIITHDANKYLMQCYNEFAADTWMQDDTTLQMPANLSIERNNIQELRMGLTLINVRSVFDISSSSII